MPVTVKLYGSLRRLSDPGTPGQKVVDWAEALTIKRLIALIGTTIAEVAAATVNGQVQPFESVIQDGDVIILVTPVGGGTQSRLGIYYPRS